jgi:hypothetical protein
MIQIPEKKEGCWKKIGDTKQSPDEEKGQSILSPIYFKTISRAFFARRGAPFFLSARDLALVGEWESRGIPLAVVLEGLERAFDGGGAGRRPQGKVLSLAFCGPQVEKAFARHLDRRAGSATRVAPRSEKRDRAAAEAARFLNNVPPGLETLRPFYESAGSILASAPPDEEALERLDERVDETLVGLAPGEERAAAERDAAKSRARDRAALAATLLAKTMRTRHRVPYLSLYYY